MSVRRSRGRRQARPRARLLLADGRCQVEGLTRLARRRRADVRSRLRRPGLFRRRRGSVVSRGDPVDDSPGARLQNEDTLNGASHELLRVALNAPPRSWRVSKACSTPGLGAVASLVSCGRPTWARRGRPRRRTSPREEHDCRVEARQGGPRCARRKDGLVPSEQHGFPAFQRPTGDSVPRRPWQVRRRASSALLEGLSHENYGQGTASFHLATGGDGGRHRVQHALVDGLRR